MNRKLKISIRLTIRRIFSYFRRLTHPGASLRRSLMSLIGFTLFFTLLAISIVVLIYVQTAEKNMWEARQREMALGAGRTVAGFLARVDASLSAVATLGSTSPAFLEELLDYQISNMPAIEEYVYVNKNGMVIANSSHNQPLLGNSFTIPQSTWFDTAKNGNPYVSEVQIAQNEKPYIIKSIPTANGNIVAVRVDMAILWDEIARVRFGNEGNAYVIDMRGRLIAHPDPEIASSYLSIGHTNEMQSIMNAANYEWAGIYSNFQNNSVSGVALPLPDTDWIVITEIPSLEIISLSLKALVVLSITNLTVGILVAVATARLLQKRVIQPMNKLTRGAINIGKGKLDHRINIESQDEIGLLASAVNKMASKLSELTNNLEAIVKRRTLQLRISKERYKLAALGSNDGFWDWDMSTDEVYYSDRWKSMLGYSMDEIGNSPEEWFSRIHAKDIDNVKISISNHINGLSKRLKIEHRLEHKNGSFRWVLVRGMAASSNGSSGPSRMAGSQGDITDRKIAEDKLRQHALHDQLTDLPNRVLLTDRLTRAAERANRERDYKFSVLFLDIDRFKDINDTIGHSAGDRLLKRLAQRIKESIHANDTVARIGGDEFVMLVDQRSEDSSPENTAERILNAISRPFEINNRVRNVTASIGIVSSRLNNNDSKRMLSDADIALYQAKANGKARFEHFHDEMREKAIARMDMEIALRKALAKKELQLHYQPIIDVNSTKLVGFEALIRWKQKGGEFIPPNEFIPLAEESGLIIPIGNWVLRTACQQLKVWIDKYDDKELTMNINVSAGQFSMMDFCEKASAILAEMRLPAQSVKLEITESVIMANSQKSTETIKHLQESGFQIQIDDFGTGYSSLSYLKDYHVDGIKIDKSFISGKDSLGKGKKIVRTIASLANALGIKVVAEGIETDEQFALLSKIQIGYAQGYLFSKPMDISMAEDYMDETRNKIQSDLQYIGIKDTYGLIEKVKNTDVLKQMN